MSVKTLGNTDALGLHINVPDVKVWEDGDVFKVLSKASSENEGWMKSTKAMEIESVGCIVQVTTQQRNPDGSWVLAEAICFVPHVRIAESCSHPTDPNIVTERKLFPIFNTVRQAPEGAK